MSEMTKENLKVAFAGESQAHMKYLAFSVQAEKEGKPHIARLFRAISHAERVHAINHLRELKGVGDTVANLEAAIGGETFEVEEMYASKRYMCAPYVASPTSVSLRNVARSATSRASDSRPSRPRNRPDARHRGSRSLEHDTWHLAQFTVANRSLCRLSFPSRPSLARTS
jgi:rubrerythrin